ncbi:MAG TPA: anion permease [Tepidisphaeraceae bacterium]|jgi:PiT family inorganic phosphate transporter|nr:anion permease [Tepidisphaeraceae bacterium]
MMEFNFLAEAVAVPVGGAGLVLVFIIITMALVFDFLNGFHDAANSIATIVSTRVLTPTQAVLWAASFDFIAAFVFGTGVAKTVGAGLVKSEFVDIYVVAGGLVGAIFWNIITWLLALPTSSSHALVSGIAGAAITKGGFGVIIAGGWIPLLIFIVLSPLIGFVLGAINMITVAWMLRRATPHRVDTLFRRLQLVSSGIFSLGHGGNDAQKTMGIIVLLLTAAGHPEWTKIGHVHLPWLTHEYGLPIILSCNAALALGTMSGGWRIVKTMGSGITRLAPVGGFCAEAAAAATIIGATVGHIPISTTHSITGAILGVGTMKGVRSVRWVWGQRIVMGWILTLPCAAFVAAITYLTIHLTIEPFFR